MKSALNRWRVKEINYSEIFKPSSSLQLSRCVCIRTCCFRSIDSHQVCCLVRLHKGPMLQCWTLSIAWGVFNVHDGLRTEVEGGRGSHLAAPVRKKSLICFQTVQNYLASFGLCPSSGMWEFYKRSQRFGDWICLRLQVDGGQGRPTQLGPSESARLNHWKTTTSQTMDRVQ
jgi:hypothetical protein